MVLCPSSGRLGMTTLDIMETIRGVLKLLSLRKMGKFLVCKGGERRGRGEMEVILV